MELILKAGAAALLCALTGLLIKKHNPEATLLLGAAASAGILIASLGILNGFQELRRQLEKMLGAGGELLIAPIVKCLAIAIVTALLGAVLGWIEDDMKERPEKLAHLYNSVFEGTINDLLTSIEKVV